MKPINQSNQSICQSVHPTPSVSHSISQSIQTFDLLILRAVLLTPEHTKGLAPPLWIHP